MVRRNTDLVSDARVRAATGQGREHWFALLDAAGARELPHGGIAGLLAAEGVPAWWTQGIAVAYEQERGLRRPGQQADGTFQVSVSRTLAASADELWPRLVQGDARAAWLGRDWELSGHKPRSSLRLRGPGDSRVTLRLAPAGAAPGRVRVSVQHAGLASAEEAEEMRRVWKEALAALAARTG